MLKEQYIPQKGLLGAIKRQPKVRHELRPGCCFTSSCKLQYRLFQTGAPTQSKPPACGAPHAAALLPHTNQPGCCSPARCAHRRWASATIVRAPARASATGAQPCSTKAAPLRHLAAPRAPGALLFRAWVHAEVLSWTRPMPQVLGPILSFCRRCNVEAKASIGNACRVHSWIVADLNRHCRNNGLAGGTPSTVVPSQQLC